MDIIGELREITARLDQERVEYALCGGLAMAIYALPRATLDIDLLIQVDSLAQARHAVEPLGFWVGTALMSFHGGKIKRSSTNSSWVSESTLHSLAILIFPP